MNEPQLSAEMEKQIEKILVDMEKHYCRLNGQDDGYLVKKATMRKLLATALEEERERIKRCLMPVVDIECNHEEGSTPVEDNLGQYHIASGVCCKCGTSVLDWKQNEPQLSAEMEKRLLDLLPLGLDDWVVEDIKHFLATALEEQKQGYVKQVRDIKYGSPKSCDESYWETSGDKLLKSQVYFDALTDVLDILNGKEE